MIKKMIFGNSIERMPDFAYKVMSFFFRIRERYGSPSKKLLNFNIEKGKAVVDYGCGPGLYIKKASELAGKDGILYAVDIHELAINDIKKRIKKEKIDNVIPILAKGHSVTIETGSIDIIYALDMFHMIKNTDSFLKELNRILKTSGLLYLEDGHQKREKARMKVNQSGFFKIDNEDKNFLKCSPLNNKKKVP
ncbi:MAG: class I SAM-dependent methyltransferase [Desulfobacterales bacterium]|nr:class I SAM-dependent methyltransferase [Desulfobacterales bacterium]